MYTQLYVPMEPVAYIQPQMPITMPMPIQQNIVDKPQQQKEEENYWACESENTIVSKNPSLVIPEIPKKIAKRTKGKMKKDRFAAKFRMDAEQRIRDLENLCVDEGLPIVRKGEKPARTQNPKHPDKRSDYIGVSGNGKKWQSLVVIGKEKVYMGTFKNEELAALVYDFYSIVIHYKEAKPNRDYTVHEIKRMLYYFKNNNYEFNPSAYMKV